MTEQAPEPHDGGVPLIAYPVTQSPLQIRAAGRRRAWMDEARFSYRCLPLAMGNQLGWELLCPVSFSAVWNGKAGKDAITIVFNDDKSNMVGSHFGVGVLTFTLGYLFRTPQGHNLWVSGPANEPRDGIFALEGLIETDWAPFTFTMNWKFTRPRFPVSFTKGDPIARILPYPRGYVEGFAPQFGDMNDNIDFQQKYKEWGRQRREFLDKLDEPGSDAEQLGWMRHYMKGIDIEGDSYKGQHQVKLELREFDTPSDETETPTS